ncbi:hypothetical protein GFC01_05505 [Desulfofundulus thermobenzoicus]|uniref:Rubrerythrin diiron-binding domain-containing protein n=1 Tax=Desulfofundulus thermobenzoicus TaxID=29376 RepID=A0A6N7INX0_9FIRM|nr:hypothetical protein [Desulfofundulus thermobenzoicus]MQL51725.1 hypothetical protein [Desulfofundulus thermobenzoicus]HHW42774.1 hypothetical protein [Desulfotomaculum sp.]
MNKMDILRDALYDKMYSQAFYNDQMLMMVNPEVRHLFMRLRDEEARHVLFLRTELLHMESNPFPITKILPGLERRPRFRM